MNCDICKNILVDENIINKFNFDRVCRHDTHFYGLRFVEGIKIYKKISIYDDSAVFYIRPEYQPTLKTTISSNTDFTDNFSYKKIVVPFDLTELDYSNQDLLLKKIKKMIMFM